MNEFRGVHYRDGMDGYETRKLENEDFEDDTKDGGEIGADQQVTVLYEIVPAGSSVAVAALRAQAKPNPEDQTPTTLRLRYKQPDGGVSAERDYPVDFKLVSVPSNDFKFASAVAETAMIINGSKYINMKLAEVSAQISQISGVQEDPYRKEFAELVEKAATVFKK